MFYIGILFLVLTRVFCGMGGDLLASALKTGSNSLSSRPARDTTLCS